MQVGNLPKHVAIIMDGNRRWAKNKHKTTLKGHRAGVKSLQKVVIKSTELNLPELTLFAFSKENWGRGATEVSNLFNVLKFLLTRKLNFLQEYNIKLKIFGEISTLEHDLQQLINEAERFTQHNTGLCLNIGINYGGRQDILQAVNQLLQEENSAEVDEHKFAQKLSLGINEVDLLIRTGGEQRLSNFLLWYLSYAELYFTNILWPDFTGDDFVEALEEFSLRQRRFGKD